MSRALGQARSKAARSARPVKVRCISISKGGEALVHVPPHVAGQDDTQDACTDVVLALDADEDRHHQDGIHHKCVELGAIHV